MGSNRIFGWYQLSRLTKVIIEQIVTGYILPNADISGLTSVRMGKIDYRRLQGRVKQR
jgi:hypothetical protein